MNLEEQTRIPILLITGTIGVGKSSVADKVFEILKRQLHPVALVNLDKLGYAYPHPENDPFNTRLQLKNLSAVWTNYKKVGVKNLIIPCVIEHQEDLKRFREAIPYADIFVVRLDAPLTVLEERIRNRPMGGTLAWHLKRAAELVDVFNSNRIEDVVIATEGKTITEVSKEVITRWADLGLKSEESKTHMESAVARQRVRDAVSAILPYDDLEVEHRQDVLDWIDSGAPLFRIERPDKPFKHLVSYFVLYDELQDRLMLIDHAKAKAWLPPGGHVDINEDPKEAAIREAHEELDITASFMTAFGDAPLFVTVTTTKGYGEHTDVSLWYVMNGDSSAKVQYSDTDGDGAHQWLTFDEILAMDITKLDPHLHRFVGKMRSIKVRAK